MNLSLENFSLESDKTAKAIALIREAGFDKIRCNLTGQIVAEMHDTAIRSAIDYMRFEEPFLSETQIVDQMQIRWLIHCSRPAPHLAGFKSTMAHTYLVMHHPRDIFAMLYGRMLFEYEKIEQEMNLTDALKRKLFWLIELQESDFFQKFSPAMTKALDALIRIDSIHSIRKAFYSAKIRKLAAQVREEIPTEKLLVTFTEEVESHALNAIVDKPNPPSGNTMSLNAALTQAGLLPWQIRLKENEAKNKSNALAFAARVIETRKLSDLERIKEGYADKQTVVMADLAGQIPAMLQAKYAAAERAEKEAAQEAKNPKTKTAKVSKSALKAAARFGNLDFTL